MKLLDVNVWLAASWARHRHHELAKLSLVVDAQRRRAWDEEDRYQEP